MIARRPIALSDDNWGTWLNPNLQEKPELERIRASEPLESAAGPVSRCVSIVRNEGPQCIEPA